MKNKRAISILVILIVALSLFSAAYGVFSNGGQGQHEIKSFYGTTVPIYGVGLYRNDSVSVASQGIAQDIVTMAVGIPLLVISLYMARKGLLKGRLLLAGTLGYFLYTYTSYCFVWMYNPMFIVYVILMSASFFAFLLSMMSFDLENISQYFDKKMPVKFLGIFCIFMGVSIGLMWMGRIIPPLLSGTIPTGLEHYTTLPIQALDLGFVVPAAVISGVLLIRRRPLGYLISSVIILKGVTMLTSITAMIIGQALSGVKMGFAEILLFPIFNLLVIYFMFIIMKNVHEPANH